MKLFLPAAFIVLACSTSFHAQDVATPVSPGATPPAQALVMYAGGGTRLIAPRDFSFGTISSGAPGVIAPKVIHQVGPEYTQRAMREKITGDVEVDAVVEPSGAISRAMVSQSLDPDLDLSALQATLEWKFEPATLRGEPVAVRIHLKLVFTLH